MAAETRWSSLAVFLWNLPPTVKATAFGSSRSVRKNAILPLSERSAAPRMTKKLELPAWPIFVIERPGTLPPIGFFSETR